MTFKEKLNSKKFIITSEIGPPKGILVEEMLKDAQLIKNRVDAINVTDLQSSVMRLGSLAACHLLKGLSIEPIYQLTCRDRNRLALQSDLLSAYVLGIENVLISTGDHPSRGDHPEAKPVFDLDSTQLLEVAKNLSTGKDMKGHPLKGSPKFCLGAVVNPGADPIEPEILKMEKKVKAGAEFFQTQAIYEIDKFERFLKLTKHIKAPLLGGVVFLKSAGMARFMNKNVAGVFVPDNLIAEMESADDKAAKSIEIAARIIKELKNLCQGVHIMPIGWDRHVNSVLDLAGL